MRRLLNFLGVIAMIGLVFALAPTSKAFAAKKAVGKGQSSGTCGSDGKDPNGQPCNCPPQYALVAIGNGDAVDDLDGNGCYSSPAIPTDPLAPNDNPELTCPSTLICGCLLAGGDNPESPGNVILAGDASLGGWAITKLEANFAYGELPSTFIGNQSGAALGTNGTRCYGSVGFAEIASTSGAVADAPTLYLELQGTVCDDIPTITDTSEPQKFSFTGSYIVDGSRSSDYYADWTGTGTFVMSISDVSTTPSAYSASNFSFNGYLLP
jgi:hypothetical protein